MSEPPRTAGPSGSRTPAGAFRPSEPRPVLLVSGLPLTRESSFSRQLRLLAGELRRRGLPAVVCGAERVHELLQTGGARALLLLGYPDQFPILSDPEPTVPVFLWAQFSRPPAPGSLGGARPVPLTLMTAGLLAGCAGVGPVIPHGVDCRLFAPPTTRQRAAARARYGLGDELVVGTVAAHTLRKRFDLMVEAFAGLKRRRPDAVFLIKTDRAVSLDGGDLDAYARRHGVAGSIRVLLGELPEESMVELYRAMDLYLNLSEWEGFCLPIVEAMSCGLPVVTHPVQGPGEILSYRELLVEGSGVREDEGVRLLRADPEEAAEVLARAAGSPRLLASLGARGRQEALRRYDLRRVAARWDRLLRDPPA